MAANSKAAALTVELKQLKCKLPGTSESFVRAGEIFETARNACELSKKQAADDYGVSESLLVRQIQNADSQHLSFTRMCEMDEAFQVEIVWAWAARLRMVIRTRSLEIREA